MHAFVLDARLADLAFLDVIDLAPDGRWTLNEGFRLACVAAYDADPSSLDHVIQDVILARAMARGVAAVLDVDELALAALEVSDQDEAEASA